MQRKTLNKPNIKIRLTDLAVSLIREHQIKRQAAKDKKVSANLIINECVVDSLSRQTNLEQPEGEPYAY